MVFQNPGAFPFGMSWTDFVDDCIGSMPSNPTIANVFYRRGTMESWGRGISLIMQSCREQGLPEPRIEIVPNFVNLTIWFKNLLFAQDNNQLEEHRAGLSEMQNRILDFCHTPKSLAEIMRYIGINDRKLVREKYIATLLASKLRLSIPDKPNSRMQKYYTEE